MSNQFSGQFSDDVRVIYPVGWEDVAGARKSLTLGPTSTLTKSQARRMLQEHIIKLGTNTGEFLERSLSPVFTFAQATDKYVAGRLQDLKPLNPQNQRISASQVSPSTVRENVHRGDHGGSCQRGHADVGRAGLSRNTLRNFVNTLRSITGKDFGRPVKYPSQVEISNDAEEPCFTPEQMRKIIAARSQSANESILCDRRGHGDALWRTGRFEGGRCGPARSDYLRSTLGLGR